MMTTQASQCVYSYLMHRRAAEQAVLGVTQTLGAVAPLLG